ncbi:MAG: hypothetical protein II776_00675, partial [Clostridia bacterium]|nr:hypothetical protein [Clostridia bacterium]
MKKKIVSVLLCLAMLLGLLPAGVLSAPDSAPGEAELQNITWEYRGEAIWITWDDFPGAVKYDYNDYIAYGYDYEPLGWGHAYEIQNPEPGKVSSTIGDL